MPGVVLKTRSEIIARLQAERRRLETNLARLAQAEIEKPGVVGKWSIKDMLAHLAEWESWLPAWMAASRRGEMVITPAPDLGWDQLDILNERIYQKHKDASLQQVLDFFRTTHDQFMRTIESLSEDEVCKPGFFNFTGDGPLFSWLVAYAEHDRWGKTEIRQHLKKMMEIVA